MSPQELPNDVAADSLRKVPKSQYHAALAMLRESIERCPDDVWESKEHLNSFCGARRGASPSESLGEVEVDYLQPFTKVETVGSGPLRPRVQVQPLAAVLPAVAFEPLDEPRTVAFGSLGPRGNQVIDIEDSTVGEILDYSKACHGYACSISSNVGQLVPVLFLSADARQEGPVLQMGA